jgi:hypothetical protein
VHAAPDAARAANSGNQKHFVSSMPACHAHTREPAASMEIPGKEKQDAANQCCLLASQRAEAARHAQKREENGGILSGGFCHPGHGSPRRRVPSG